MAFRCKQALPHIRNSMHAFGLLRSDDWMWGVSSGAPKLIWFFVRVVSFSICWLGIPRYDHFIFRFWCEIIHFDTMITESVWMICFVAVDILDDPLGLVLLMWCLDFHFSAISHDNRTIYPMCVHLLLFAIAAATATAIFHSYLSPSSVFILFFCFFFAVLYCLIFSWHMSLSCIVWHVCAHHFFSSSIINLIKSAAKKIERKKIVLSIICIDAMVLDTWGLVYETIKEKEESMEPENINDDDDDDDIIVSIC